ncbi:MAG: DUF881 domain-containing protein, partial [Micrococcales bacterium]|nr:DUF881 domain-containing protein [Micrococcales bacterium]
MNSRQLAAAALCAIVGFGAVIQVQQRSQADFSGLREVELLELLDQLTLRSDELTSQNAALEAQKETLLTARDKAAAAREQAQARTEVQGLLAGTLAAQGPGIILIIDDPNRALTAMEIYHVLAELRNAGAEAISLGNVRVTASTWVGEGSGGLVVQGEPITPPYAFRAIGDAKTLEVALNIPGGVTATVRTAGGTAAITPMETLVIDQVVAPPTP